MLFKEPLHYDPQTIDGLPAVLGNRQREIAEVEVRSGSLLNSSRLTGLTFMNHCILKHSCCDTQDWGPVDDLIQTAAAPHPCYFH